MTSPAVALRAVLRPASRAEVAERSPRRPPLLPSLVALTATAALVVAVGLGVPARDLVRDPAPYLGTPLHVGVLSTLGVLLWAVAGALAVVASVAEPRLRVVAAVSALCALDDAYLLHEEVWPSLTGFPEELALLPYAALALLLARRLRGLAPRVRHAFMLAVAALGTSVVLDLVGSPLALLSGTAEDVRNLVEELVKLGGIALWVSACWRSARSAVDASGRRPD